METKLRRAREIKEILDSVKPLYEELDTITLEVADELETIVRVDGLIFNVVDNFAEKNTVFRPVGVKRFELKIMTEEEFAYSNMTKSEKSAFTRAKNKAAKQL